MPKMTSVEDSMKRLLRLCPNITLSTEQVQMIADGNMNGVIAIHNKADIIINRVNTNTQTTDEITSTAGNNITIDKSFDEYFKD